MDNQPTPRRILIPYTVPVGFSYAKGSGPWLETLASALIKNSKYSGEPLDVYILGPAYESWSNIKYPWRVLPINYIPPGDFPEGHIWHKDFPKQKDRPAWNGVPEDGVDIKTPIHTFTSNVAYTLTKEVEANAFRAITETTRWRMDFIPALFGFKEFDAVFPQHVSWNLIASAHYARAGKAVGICHETCMRGGWLSRSMRPHIRLAFDEQDGATKIIAISDPVEELLCDAESGPQFDAARVEVKENPVNEEIFFRLEEPLSKAQMVREIVEMVKTRDPNDERNYTEQEIEELASTPTDGNWITFVGRTAEFKGAEQLLRGWAAYLKTSETSRSDVLFLMGKFFVPDSYFAKYAEELGIADNVRFLGFSKPPFINRMHNASDLFAMTSLGEGDGVVVKEAAAAGLRVLVPDSGGPSKTVSGEGAIMGRKFISRDPDPKCDKIGADMVQRYAFQFLRDNKKIKWGNITISGPNIVRHYIRWRSFYDQGIKDPAERARLDEINRVLTAIADNWDSKEVLDIRSGAEALLRGKNFVFKNWRQHAQLLAEVFRTFSGMAVETQTFAEELKAELAAQSAQDPQMRKRRSEEISKYTHNRYASRVYARELYDEYLEPSFDLKLDPPTRHPLQDWDDTTLRHLKKDDAVAKAFRVWENAQTYGELVAAVMDFDRAVVSNLGNPASYENTWPEAVENAMHRPYRSTKVAALLAGVDTLHFEWQREALMRETARHEGLRDAFYQKYHGRQLDPILRSALDSTRIGAPLSIAAMNSVAVMATSGMAATPLPLP